MAVKVGQSLIEEETGPGANLMEGGEGSVAQAGQAGVLAAGGSEDQAKMAGTPQAKQGLTNKIATKAKDTLAGSKRLKKPKEKQQETQADIEYTERLKKLGSLGGSIQKLVDDSIAEAAQADMKLEVNEDFTTGSPEATTTYTTGVDALNTAIANGEDVTSIMTSMENDLLKLSQETPPKFPSAMIGKLREGLDKDIAGMIAGQIAEGTIDAEDVNINRLLDAGIMEVEDLGLSEDELNNDLGTNWVNMTPKQLTAAVDRLNAIKFGESDQLMGMLNDPFISASQKEDIKDRLWDMGNSGELQRESDVDTLAQQVEDSGMVEFGGKVMDLDEMLDDENMNATMNDYLKGTDADKAAFAKENPELAAYLDKNKESMESAMELIEGTEETLNTIRKENEKVYTFGVIDGNQETGVKMNEEALSALFPDYEPGSFTSEGLSSDDPLFKYLKDNPKTAGALVTTINGLADVDPSLVSDMMKSAGGDPVKFQKMIAGLSGEKGKQAIKGAELALGFDKIDKTSTDSMVKFFLGDNMTMDSLTSDMAKLKNDAMFSPRSADKYKVLSKIFDADGDGELDSPEKISAAIEKEIGSRDIDLNDIVNGNNPVARTAGVATQTPPPLSPGMATAQKLLGSFMSGPNDLPTAREVTQGISGVKDTNELTALLNSGIKLDKKSRTAIFNKGMDIVSKDAAFQATIPSIDPATNITLDGMKNLIAKGSGNNLRRTVFNSKQIKVMSEYKNSLKSAMNKETNPYKKAAIRAKFKEAEAMGAQMDKIQNAQRKHRKKTLTNRRANEDKQRAESKKRFDSMFTYN